jgi:hypothetical protein
MGVKQVRKHLGECGPEDAPRPDPARVDEDPAVGVLIAISACHLSSLIILPVPWSWPQLFAMTAWRRPRPGSSDPVLTQTFVAYGPPGSLTLFMDGGGGRLYMPRSLTFFSVRGGGGVGMARRTSFFSVGGGGGQRLTFFKKILSRSAVVAVVDGG